MPISTVKNTTNSEKNISPISIFERSGFVSVFGRLSESISKNTIIESITVTEKDIRSPEFHGTKRLIIISVAVANVGIIIFST